jgi:hypothetical protein
MLHCRMRFNHRARKGWEGGWTQTGVSESRNRARAAQCPGSRAPLQVAAGPGPVGPHSGGQAGGPPFFRARAKQCRAGWRPWPGLGLPQADSGRSGDPARPTPAARQAIEPGHAGPCAARGSRRPGGHPRLAPGRRPGGHTGQEACRRGSDSDSPRPAALILDSPRPTCRSPADTGPGEGPGGWSLSRRARPGRSRCSARDARGIERKLRVAVLCTLRVAFPSRHSESHLRVAIPSRSESPLRLRERRTGLRRSGGPARALRQSARARGMSRDKRLGVTRRERPGGLMPPRRRPGWPAGPGRSARAHPHAPPPTQAPPHARGRADTRAARTSLASAGRGPRQGRGRATGRRRTLLPHPLHEGAGGRARKVRARARYHPTRPSPPSTPTILDLSSRLSPPARPPARPPAHNQGDNSPRNAPRKRARTPLRIGPAQDRIDDSDRIRAPRCFAPAPGRARPASDSDTPYLRLLSTQARRHIHTSARTRASMLTHSHRRPQARAPARPPARRHTHADTRRAGLLGIKEGGRAGAARAGAGGARGRACLG